MLVNKTKWQMIEVDNKDLKFSEEKAVPMGCPELGAHVLSEVITSVIYSAFAACQAPCLASYLLGPLSIPGSGVIFNPNCIGEITGM